MAKTTKPRAVDIGEFSKFLNAQNVADAPNVRFAVTGDAVVAGDSRTASFVFSDESVDRYGDTISARGWDLANFQKNPIALFGHDSGSVENAIGRAKNVRVEGTRLVGDIEFMEAAVNHNAEAVYQMVKGGWLKTVSVGFAPLEWEPSKTRKGGVDFKKQELLEISIVPIPANPNAIALAKAAGVDVGRLNLQLSPPVEDRQAGTAGQSPDLIQGEGSQRPTDHRALAKGYRKRGLYEVASLCDILAYLDWICERVEDEAEDEGDNSPLPVRMRAWVNEGAAILAAMAKEETDELIGGTEAVDVEAQVEAGVAAGVQKALFALGLARSGKRLSAETERCLREAHEHVCAAGNGLLTILEPPADEDPDPTDDPDAEARAIRERKARAAAARTRIA